VSDLHRAVALAASADPARVERAYWSAVADGAANTRAGAQREHDLGTLRLLTLATLRLPDLALQAYLLDAADGDGFEVVDFALQGAWATGAGALRLTHRALEAHAYAIGYDPDAWASHARGRAHATLVGIEPTLIEGAAVVAQERVRCTAVALARATAAAAEDQMRVPDEIATALAHLLALLMIASEAIAA
jgi:hypothetical protein